MAFGTGSNSAFLRRILKASWKHYCLLVPYGIRRLISTMLLLLMGVCCIFIPRAILTEGNLPPRYSNFIFLGDVLFYVGIILFFIGILKAALIVFTRKGVHMD